MTTKAARNIRPVQALWLGATKTAAHSSALVSELFVIARKRTSRQALCWESLGRPRRDNMSAKAAARKASKRARREQEVVMGPAVAAGTGVRRGPPVAPTSGLLSGSVVNDEWQTVRRSWCDLHALQPRPHPCSYHPTAAVCHARAPTERCLTCQVTSGRGVRGLQEQAGVDALLLRRQVRRPPALTRLR